MTIAGGTLHHSKSRKYHLTLFPDNKTARHEVKKNTYFIPVNIK